MGETLEEQQPVAAEVENQFLWARRTAGGGKEKKFFLCPSLPRSSSNNGLERTNRRIRVRRSGRARLERNFALSTSSSYCVSEVSFPPPARSERILSMEKGKGRNEKGPSFKRGKEPRQLFLLPPPKKTMQPAAASRIRFVIIRAPHFFAGSVWEEKWTKERRERKGNHCFSSLFWH